MVETMNPQFKLAREFDKTLAVGQRVEVRWTNCNNYWRGFGEVVKVNTHSARVRLTAATGPYPEGFVVLQNRMTLSKMPLWSWNNCILPDTEEFRNA